MTPTNTEIADALDYHGPKHLEEIGYEAEKAGERNRLRSYWAAKALDAYTAEVGGDTAETVICDLIADLRHFATSCKDEDGNPIDDAAFLEIQDRAERRWVEEAFLGE